MSTLEIPLTAESQTFSITLADVEYRLTLVWRDDSAGGWFLDIADVDGAALVCGIPLVTGVDLLGQYGYLGIGGALYVQTDNDPDEVPTFDNLGDTAHVYFVAS